MALAHDVLEDDLLDGEAQLEQIGDPAPAVVGDAQTALCSPPTRMPRTCSFCIASRAGTRLTCSAEAISASVMRSPDGLVAARNGDDQALFHLVRRRPRRANRRKRGSLGTILNEGGVALSDRFRWARGSE